MDTATALNLAASRWVEHRDRRIKFAYEQVGPWLLDALTSDPSDPVDSVTVTAAFDLSHQSHAVVTGAVTRSRAPLDNDAIAVALNAFEPDRWTGQRTGCFSVTHRPSPVALLLMWLVDIEDYNRTFTRASEHTGPVPYPTAITGTPDAETEAFELLGTWVRDAATASSTDCTNAELTSTAFHCSTMLPMALGFAMDFEGGRAAESPDLASEFEFMRVLLDKPVATSPHELLKAWDATVDDDPKFQLLAYSVMATSNMNGFGVVHHR